MRSSETWLLTYDLKTAQSEADRASDQTGDVDSLKETCSDGHAVESAVGNALGSDFVAQEIARGYGDVRASDHGTEQEIVKEYGGLGQVSDHADGLTSLNAGAVD